MMEKEKHKSIFQKMLLYGKFLNDHRKNVLMLNSMDLASDEKGRKKVIWSSYLKPLIMMTIACFAFYSIVMTNINKLNTLKT